MEEDNRFLRAYAEHKKEKEQEYIARQDASRRFDGLRERVTAEYNTASRFDGLRDRISVGSEHNTASRFECLRDGLRGRSVSETSYQRPHIEYYTPSRAEGLRPKEEPIRLQPTQVKRVTIDPFPELSKHTFNNTSEEHILNPVQVPHKHILPESAISIRDTSLSEITSLGFKNGECVKNTVLERDVISTTKVVYSSWADVMKTTYIFDN